MMTGFDDFPFTLYPWIMLRLPCRGILWSLDPTLHLNVLNEAGCEIRVVADELAAIDLKIHWRPEVVLLDHVKPGQGGRLRRTPPHLNLVYCALLERHELSQVEQPDYDDFLVLPLEAVEVAARIRLWRWRRERLSGGLLRVGPLAVDLRHLRVTMEGVPVELTYKEYELLILLLKRRGQVLTRDSILDAVWGPDYYGGERTVDVHIRRLRMKLPEVAEQITTLHGLGYRFD